MTSAQWNVLRYTPLIRGVKMEILENVAGGRMNWARAWLIGTLTVSGLSFPPPEADSVRIISISPNTGAPLRVGESVTFRVEVEYNLVSAESGQVTLVIQQSESGRAPLANEVEVVERGKSRLVLSKDIRVPDTKTIRVFTPLNVQGGTSTRIVDTRSYKVESSGGSPGVSPPESLMDSVKIISISPSTGAPLRVGQSVTLRVEVEYNLVSAESGQVALVIQQGESGRPPIAHEMEVVLKGKARLVLSTDITVPDTKALRVFIPLHVEGGRSTNVVETRSYKVAKI
jgi:hypothetical protein